jgi:hypothetical protein
MRVKGILAGWCAVAVLGGCATLEGLLGIGGAGRADGAAEAPPTEAAPAAAVDWSLAFTRTLRVRQNEFTPLVLTLRTGQPYILRLENGDDAGRAFSAPDFFEAVAVKSLTPAEPGFEPGAALSAIDLPPGQTRELAFVPVRDGYYSFAGGWAVPGLVGLGGGQGLIVIEAASRP